jgi:hypothetical protein
VRSLHPAAVRIAMVCDNYSPHLTTRKDKRVGQWAPASNVEIACTPTNSSWMNRLECQFTALREFTLNGTNHAAHREQGSIIRRYIACGTATPPIRRDRTPSAVIANPQLDAKPVGPGMAPRACSRSSISISYLVGRTGFEPVTSSVSECRPSSLSSGIGAVTWAYAHHVLFALPSVSCAYLYDP